MSASSPVTTHGHVIVCGLDHLGLRTIDELRMRDEDVVAIGPNADAEDRLTAHGVRLVVGDPLVPRVLREAGIETADAVVMTSGDDLDNLNIGLAIQETNPAARLVIRMFDTELGGQIPDLFNDAVALSSSALAAPGFVSAAIDGETGGRFELAGRVLTSRTSADPAVGDRSVPIGRLLPDRSAEILPEADPGEANLILVDVAVSGGPLPDQRVAATADASSSGSTRRHAGSTGFPARPGGRGSGFGGRPLGRAGGRGARRRGGDRRGRHTGRSRRVAPSRRDPRGLGAHDRGHATHRPAAVGPPFDPSEAVGTLKRRVERLFDALPPRD